MFSEIKFQKLKIFQPILTMKISFVIIFTQVLMFGLWHLFKIGKTDVNEENEESIKMNMVDPYTL